MASERFVLGMFSYGSNNNEQMRSRVKNQTLRGFPAILEDYARIFAADSISWGGGGVASIVPKEGSSVFGCFYLMSPSEVELLDVYEGVKQGVYTKEAVMVTVLRAGKMQDGVGGEGEIERSGQDRDEDEGKENQDEGDSPVKVRASAIAYIMSPRHAVQYKHPSPQYLCAVHRLISSNFPELWGQPLDICDSEGTKRAEWVHPGYSNLSLEAFLLEVGLREDPPWRFPLAIGPAVERLKAAGIATVTSLCQAAAEDTLLSSLEFTGGDISSPNVGATAVNPKTAEGINSIGFSKEGKPVPLPMSLRDQQTAPPFTEHTVAIVLALASEKTRGGCRHNAFLCGRGRDRDSCGQ